MSFSRPIQWYHSHADPICPDGTFNASLYINNVVGVYRYLVQVSLLFIGQQGLRHFFSYLPLLPVSWRIVQILFHSQRKTTNAAPKNYS